MQYLKQSKKPDLATRWPKKRIKETILKELGDKGYDVTFLSRENYLKLQQAFGPPMRKLNEENPRISMRPDKIQEIQMAAMSLQSFNEGSLKTDGMMFYTDGSEKWLKGDQKALFLSLTQNRQNYEKISEALKVIGQGTGDIQYLRDNLHPIDEKKFKTPLGIVYVAYTPECQFMRKIYDHTVLIDSFVKNPDESFY